MDYFHQLEFEVEVLRNNVPLDDLISEKYSAVVDEIELLTKAGRPVLVGTTSVEISEMLGRYLKMKGISHGKDEDLDLAKLIPDS